MWVPDAEHQACLDWLRARAEYRLRVCKEAQTHVSNNVHQKLVLWGWAAWRWSASEGLLDRFWLLTHAYTKRATGLLVHLSPTVMQELIHTRHVRPGLTATLCVRGV